MTWTLPPTGAHLGGVNTIVKTSAGWGGPGFVVRGRGPGRALLRSAAECQAPAPGEAAPARNRTLRTQSRAWGQEAPGSAQLASDTEVGTPLHPLTLGEGRGRGCSGRIPNSTPSSDRVGVSTCYQGLRGLPMGDLVPDSTGARGPPRRPAAPRVRTSRLPAQRRQPCSPAARQGSQRRGRACERAGGAAGGAAPRPSQARCAFRPATLGPAWPGLRRAAPSGPSGCRIGHVSAEVRAWGGGGAGAGAGLPAAPGACSREWDPCWLRGAGERSS